MCSASKNIYCTHYLGNHLKDMSPVQTGRFATDADADAADDDADCINIKVASLVLSLFWPSCV